MNDKQKSGIYWLIFIIVVVAVGSFFYFQMGDEGGGLWGDEENESNIMVEELANSEKVINNAEAKYSIRVPNDWNVTEYDNYIKISNVSDEKIGSSGFSGIGCQTIIQNTNILDLSNYAENYCDSDPDCEKYEIIDINNSLQSLAFFGSFMGTGDITYYLKPLELNKYYTSFSIICSGDSLMNKYIEDLLSSFTRIN
ncbi:hypothetical protein KJ641_02180 [Patescibacteria group bacterium]|nr:hypothetical protein [Patescibacteria group bacterium]MBU1895654.1 hypothetical protein [Patescibacteria group bacterium]